MIRSSSLIRYRKSSKVISSCYGSIGNANLFLSKKNCCNIFQNQQQQGYHTDFQNHLIIRSSSEKKNIKSSSTTSLIPNNNKNNKRSISTFVLEMEDEDTCYTNDLIFDLTAEQIEKECEELIKRSREIQDKVANIPENERTFDNVILPLAYDEGFTSTFESSLTFPSYVSTDKAIRDAGSKAEEKLSEFAIESMMREDVYKSIKTVEALIEKEKENKYSEEDKRLVKRMIRDFERNGLGLPEEKRSQVKDLKNQLSKLSIQFTKNIAEDKTELLFSEDELDGCPQDFIKQLKLDEGSNKRVVTLKYPDIVPVMKYCKVEETRKKLDFARSSQCQEVNVPIFEEAIKIRQKLANLMGYKTHADYVLEVNMATPEEVKKFLGELKEKLLDGGNTELSKLKQLKGSNEFYSWDLSYYLNRLKEDEFNVDDNLVKQYFPLDKVLNGILSIAQETLSLRFEEVKDPKVWFEDVQMYAVFDKESDKFLGQFYLDLYPREGKYTHFAAFPLSPHWIDEKGKEHYPVSAMVCNFSKPSKENGVSLLKHDEVVTFFHEFGHLAHGFLSKVKYARFSGTRTERDFVEMPSQFQENYCWEVESLKRISSHYQSGEPLPDELIKKMTDAKNVGVALLTLRQLFFGIFDMTLHTIETEEEAQKLNSGALWSKIRKEVTLIDAPEGTNGAASFGHLLGGYDAGYYGYLYSEVFSFDMFSVFKKNGIFNPKVGKRLRELVLERGGSKDGHVMLKEFLGREPSQDAFLEDIGLKEPSH
ncbi:hypothetical protein ABK040_001427 [Willaertia magna]